MVDAAGISHDDPTRNLQLFDSDMNDMLLMHLEKSGRGVARTFVGYGLTSN